MVGSTVHLYIHFVWSGVYLLVGSGAEIRRSSAMCRVTARCTENEPGRGLVLLLAQLEFGSVRSNLLTLLIRNSGQHAGFSAGT